MKILILGGGSSQLPFIEFCLKRGHSVDVLDIDPKFCQTKIQHENLFIFEIDIASVGNVLEHARKSAPNAVISPSNDAGLLSAMRVAEEYHLPGPGRFATTNSRDKFKFRTILSAADLPSPWFFQIKQNESLEVVDNAIPNYPCVIKPVVGSGSKGVRFLASPDDLFSYFQNARVNMNVEMFQIEEFIEGVEYSLEGIVQNGVLYVLAIFRKVRSDLPNLVDVQVCFPPRISQKVEKEASILAQRIVMALKVENAPIHLEFILSPSRGLVPVECAVRGAGFNLFNFMVPWCTGVDVMGAQLNLILGNPLRDIAPKRKYAAILEFPQPKTGGKIQKISYRNPSEDSLLFKSYVEIQMNKVIGETVVPATNGSERIGHIFIFSETWSEVESIYSKIDFSIEVE